MSERKKRKISKKGDNINEEEESIIVFQNELLKHLDSNKMRIYRWGWGQKLKKLSEDERRKEYLKNRSDFESRMKKTLSYVHFRTLRTLFKKYFTETGLSKVHIIQSLVSKFYGDEPDFKKRKLEFENIEELEKDDEFNEDFNFVEILGVTIPRDVFVHILSFLKRDNNLLFGVGSTNKCFYYHILSSWTEVRILKENLYQISLLVLKSVRKVTIFERTVSSKFLNRELEYFFQKLNQDRLREFVFILTPTRFPPLVKSFIDVKEKSKNPFQNVEKVIFRLKGCHEVGLDRGTLTQQQSTLRNLKYDSKKLNFCDLMPKVNYVEDPYCIDICKNMKQLKTLKLTYYPQGSLTQLQPEKIRENVTRSLKTLHLKKFVDQGSYSFFDRCSFFQPKLLELWNTHFTELETLKIDVRYSNLEEISNNCQSLSFPFLTNFSIYERVMDYKFEMRGHQSTLPFLKDTSYLHVPNLEKMTFLAFKRLLFFECPSFSQLFTETMKKCRYFKGAYTLGIYKNVEKLKEQEKFENDFAQFFFSTIVKRFDFFTVDLRNDYERAEVNFAYLAEILRIRYDASTKRLFIGLGNSNNKKRSDNWFRQKKEKLTRNRALFNTMIQQLSFYHGDRIQSVVITDHLFLNKEASRDLLVFGGGKEKGGNRCPRILGSFEWERKEFFKTCNLFEMIDVKRLYYDGVYGYNSFFATRPQQYKNYSSNTQVAHVYEKKEKSYILKK